MAKENETASFEKIKNGYIINHSWSETKSEGEMSEFISERTYFKTATETSDELSELNKKILKTL